MGKKKKKEVKTELSIEEIINKNKKTRLIIKLIILFLLLVCLGLFLFKKNVIPTTFYLKGDKDTTIHLEEEYKDPGVVAKLFGGDISDNVKVSGKVDNKKIGKYEVVYKLEIKYLNISKKIVRIVNVVDNVPPELNVECEETIYWNLQEGFSVPSYSATDNIDGDITDKVQVENNVNTDAEGEYTVKFTVSDSSNNKTEKVVKVIVEDKWKNTYIIVDKSEQTLYYYEKGVLVFTSPVVTGNDYDTPLGDFAINNKMERARLVGPNNEWDCYVNWWMPFISSSHGFHDSSWRTDFGGNVWTYNPTHGCINLPADKAREMFYTVEIGTPVHIIP